MPFVEVPVESLEMNPFAKIGREWMLVTAGDERGCNTMTASWGGLGVLWGRNVATCYIRPTRHTKQFVDAADLFTLSFYGQEHRRALQVLGTKSGRDGDKVAEVGFTPAFVEGTTTFEQASLTLVCRKLYSTLLGPEGFCAAGAQIDAQVYAAKDYHTMYVGEVVKALAKE